MKLNRSVRTRLLIIASIIALSGLLAWPQYQKMKAAQFPRVEMQTSKNRSPAGENDHRRVRPGSVLFKAKKNLNNAQHALLARKLKEFKLQPSESPGNSNRIATAIKDASLLEPVEIAANLMATGTVEYAEPDFLIDPSFIPNDTYLSSQWHHQTINSYAAWDRTSGNPATIAAICDTGIENSHPDLAENLISPGYNAEDRAESNLVPVNPHGTMVAGVIAAVGNNNLGVSGVASHIRIFPIKVSNTSDGAAYLSTISHCIEYAADHGAKVVNVSYAVSDSASIDASAQYLSSKGGVLVMAAGNDGADLSAKPDYPSSITVGASDPTDMRASWSNYGTPIDLVAPGTDIFTTSFNAGFAYAAGTSFSAPLVSGAAALVYSVAPNLTGNQVKDVLYSSANHPPNWSEMEIGSGRLDVSAAVALAVSMNASPTPVPTPVPTSTPVPSPVLTTLKFSAIADANISKRKPLVNFGRSSALKVSRNLGMESYLRFNLSGLKNIQNAKLRIYVTRGLSKGPFLYPANSAWTEYGINYNNRPGANGVAFNNAARISTSTWVEYDVSWTVKANGIYNFVFLGSGDGESDFASRESSHVPEIVITQKVQ